jgi:hypothetical protein
MQPKIGVKYMHINTPYIFVIKVLRTDGEGFTVKILFNELLPSHVGNETYWGPTAYDKYVGLTPLIEALL